MEQLPGQYRSGERAGRWLGWPRRRGLTAGTGRLAMLGFGVEDLEVCGVAQHGGFVTI